MNIDTETCMGVLYTLRPKLIALLREGLMILRLSEKDKALVRELRADGVGVLEAVDAHRLDQNDGAVLVACADGDQLWDVFAHHAQTQVHRATPRMHLLSLNGGALLLPFNSKLSRATHEDIHLLRHIKAGLQMKTMKTIALYAHAPCNAATQCELDVLQCVGYLMDAKVRIKEEVPDVSVACFLHVDYSNDNDAERKRTYFVSPTNWRKWIGADPH